MRSDFLPFSPPSISQSEIDAVVETLRSGWITSGPGVRRFEAEFAARVAAPDAAAMGSCTAAMHTCLKALGVGPGDEVITTTWTFCATANVIEHVGAKPVLVDIDPDTLNLDPEAVERALTPSTRAIIPVHFAGHPAPLDALASLCGGHRVHLIEDAAHGLGAEYRGRPIGTGPNPAAFSFYATKNLTTGEGGMLTGPSGILDEARVLALHGMSREAWARYGPSGSWRYDVAAPGFKYNMTDIQATIGIAQLGRFDAMQARRRSVAEAYCDALANNDALILPSVRSDTTHAWHLFVVRLRPEAIAIDRDRFVAELRSRNIGSSVHFIPLPALSHYRERYGLRIEDFPVTANNAERVLSLPLHPGLSDSDVADVVEAVLDITSRHQKHSVAA